MEQPIFSENKIDYSKELLDMMKLDQEARERFENTGENWDQSLDKNNTQKLKEIVEKIGWPKFSTVGKEASEAAWLIVQHADHDTEFQQTCLEMMKQLPEGEISKQNIAFLEDRVRVNTGQKTLYGTQFFENEMGEFQVQPIEDPENLAKRREEMGLEPFEEYEKEMLEINDKLKQNN